MDLFGCEFIQVYGLTETTGAITQLDGVDHDPHHRPELLRSCGKPYPWVEVRVVDADGGDVGRRDRRRTVGARVDQNMAGYWNNPDATAATVTPDGWLKTGDAGYFDEDGFLYLHDRVKDMIVSGGENVYPAEVENVLMTHPDVADVAVIGVPDEKWGEAVKAVVVPAAGSRAQRGDLHRLRPRAAGRLQVAQVGRLRRRAAAQPERQAAQAGTARAVLGGRRTPHPLSAASRAPRACAEFRPAPACRGATRTLADRSWTDGDSGQPSAVPAGGLPALAATSTATQIGLAIAREYGAGTVFYAGQSLIELAGHGAPPADGAPPFPGALWLQVRDVHATQRELGIPRRADRPRGTSRTLGPA